MTEVVAEQAGASRPKVAEQVARDIKWERLMCALLVNVMGSM